MKQQINFRASDLAAHELDWLMQRWGTSQTETLTVALDRVYRAENAMNLKPLTWNDAYCSLRVATQDSDGPKLIWGTIYDVHEGSASIVWDDCKRTDTRFEDLVFDAK